jgi:hypothetical protein
MRTSFPSYSEGLLEILQIVVFIARALVWPTAKHEQTSTIAKTDATLVLASTATLSVVFLESAMGGDNRHFKVISFSPKRVS